MNITTKRLGALVLVGLALASLACSPKQDTAAGDAPSTAAAASATALIWSRRLTRPP